MKRTLVTAAIAALAAFACTPAPARDCDWHTPGASPYRGDPAVAIGKLVEIPPATRAVLAVRVLRFETYDDVVYIDRDSIRSAVGGSREYDPAIYRMNEGSGAICDTVARNWSPDHVESAVVYCEDGWCIGRISACNNIAIFRRLGHLQLADGLVPEAVLQLPDVRPLAVAVPGYGPGPLVGAPPPPDVVPGYPVPPGWYGPPTYVAGPPVYLSPAITPPIAPIPEPATWALLAAGVVAIGLRGSCR